MADKMEGVIKFYSYKKRYGFIICDETFEEIFFDKKNVLDDPSFFKPQDKVVFNIFENFKGKKYAVNVMRSDINYKKECGGLF